MDNGQLKIDNARLPKGWEIKNIGDICEYDKQQGKINNRIYVGLEDIESNTGKFVGLNKPKIVKSTTFYFSNKHLLYGRLRPYLNKVLVPSFEGHCSTEIFPIKVNGTIDRQFLARWLMQDIVVDRINSTCTGTRMPRANMKEVLNFQIPIPPLPEQKRIVKILDKAFQAIDKAKENAEKNLQNAKELFESYLNGIFANPGKDWEEKRLGDSDLVEIIDGDRGKNYPTKKDFLDKGFCLFLNTKNVRPDGFEFNTTMFISEAKDKAMGKGKLKRNDVVMTTRGTNPLCQDRCRHK